MGRHYFTVQHIFLLHTIHPISRHSANINSLHKELNVSRSRASSQLDIVDLTTDYTHGTSCVRGIIAVGKLYKPWMWMNRTIRYKVMVMASQWCLCWACWDDAGQRACLRPWHTWSNIFTGVKETGPKVNFFLLLLVQKPLGQGGQYKHIMYTHE